MAKTVRVTPAQVKAAQFKVARSAASGRFVPASVQAIANAKRQPAVVVSSQPRSAAS